MLVCTDLIVGDTDFAQTLQNDLQSSRGNELEGK